MANLDDFRGPGEADSGTAFEVGFAVALGKPVWAYCNDDGTLLERAHAQTGEQGEPLCARGFVVEDFGLPKNLMLACAATIVYGGPQACLEAIRRDAGAASAREREDRGPRPQGSQGLKA